VVACAGGRHAHPLIIPWDLAALIPTLPRDRGVNALVENYPDRVVELELAQPMLETEFNTPEDLKCWGGGTASMLRIRLFAVAKERAGRAEVDIAIVLPATVAALRGAIAEQHPKLASLAQGVLIAIDSEYARNDSLVSTGSKVALIPPVSGGQGPSDDRDH
jgi:molybdopterin converting factor subunit 1